MRPATRNDKRLTLELDAEVVFRDNGVVRTGVIVHLYRDSRGLPCGVQIAFGAKKVYRAVIYTKHGKPAIVEEG